MGISPNHPSIARAYEQGQVVEHNKTNLPGCVPNAPSPHTVTEEEFRVSVKELAASLGWLTYHTNNSRKSDPGFPDVVFVRERVFYAELKSQSGKKPTPDQRKWAKALKDAGAEYYLWRPADWEEAVRVLSTRVERP